MATEEKERFVLYEYLLFFWKKKLWFLIITIATMLIVALAVNLLLKKSAYEGDATIFVGSIDSKSLTDPTAVEALYGQNLKNSYSVDVPNEGYIKFIVKGKNQQSVTDDLNTFTNRLTKDLLKSYNDRYNVTQGYVDGLQEKVDNLNKIDKNYEQKLTNSNLSIDVRNSYVDLITTNKLQIGDATAAMNKSKGDLVIFEKPALLSSSVGHGKSYMKQGLAIGFILGILFSFGILMLWKYIFEARKFY